jgi:hypothetical protein
MPVQIHPEKLTWNRAEYAAGFQARLNGIPAPERAHNAWLCGWEDADVDLAESARHRQVIEAGEADDYGESWGALFDAGGDARVNGIGFDEDRTAPWKEGWIDADIKLGTIGS